MILNKITTGFVIQRFDTETKQFVDQEFVASDDVSFENEYGEPVGSELFCDENGDELYLPFNMANPADKDTVIPVTDRL